MPLSLLNPWVILGILAALFGAYGAGHHEGYAARDAEMQAQIAKMNDEARDKERAMQAAANATATNLRKANQDAQTQISQLNADVSSGARRLSISASCVQASPDARAADGTGGQTRAELDATVAQTLIAIAADGDNAIRQANACADFYNQVKAKQ